MQPSVFIQSLKLVFVWCLCLEQILFSCQIHLQSRTKHLISDFSCRFALINRGSVHFLHILCSDTKIRGLNLLGNAYQDAVHSSSTVSSQ